MGWKVRLGIGAGVLVVVASLAWVRLVYLPSQPPSRTSIEVVKSLVGRECSLESFPLRGRYGRIEFVSYDPRVPMLSVFLVGKSGRASSYGIGLRTEADVHHFCSLFGVSAGWSGTLSELYKLGL